MCSCILPIVPFSAILTQKHGGGVGGGGRGKQNKIKFCYVLSLQILKGNFLIANTWSAVSCGSSGDHVKTVVITQVQGSLK